MAKSPTRKTYYKALILNILRKHDRISRVGIVAMAKIRPATVTELVRELSQEGFVIESGLDDSPRGRKQILLELNAGNGLVVGLEFNADYISSVVVDLEAKILNRSHKPLPPRLGKDAMLAEIIQNIRKALAEVNSPREKILGIGLADPGLIDSRNGLSLFSSTIHGWRDVPLKSILEDEFHLTVHLEENTRTKALCENRYGAGRGTDNMMFVEFGSGIGCGLIIEGRLLAGSSQTAGELGHMQIMENGPQCTCGSSGCLEAVASLPAIAQRVRLAIAEGAVSMVSQLAGQNGDAITANHVFQAARQGDKLAWGIIDDTARYLGIGIANAVNLFNPELIVLDQRLGQVADLILEPLQRTIRRQALEVSMRKLQLVVSKFGDEGGALGAATMVLDRFFQIPQLVIPEGL